MAWLMNWLIASLLLTSIYAQAKPSAVEFHKKKIKINNVVLTVEVAETPQQQERGLMFRESLAPNSGMLFIFPDEDYRSFWMKNTYIDLSIGYFDKNRKLLEVIDMKATSPMQVSYPNYPSRKPAKYALEVPKGWFKTHRIKTGDAFVWD